MSILKDIPELLKAEIISLETADRISKYYNSKGGHSQNRLVIVFGILGAMLMGLGIILIIAHNWDEFSRSTKTCFAFIPLITGQLLCGFTLIKKGDSTAWREGSSVFLFFAAGAAISMVGQIYNIPGDVSSFLLTWMLLCLPLVYIMKSSAASLLYIAGITYYAAEASYWSYPKSESYHYWLLLAAVIPYYLLLLKEKPAGNFATLHNWLIPLSVTFILGTVADHAEPLIYIAYISLFGLFYLIGNSAFFEPQKAINNGYQIIGSLGTLSVLLTLSFDWFWEDLRTKPLPDQILYSAEFISTMIFSIAALALFTLQRIDRPIKNMKAVDPVFILFIIIFIIGFSSSVSVVLINALVFAIGLLTVWNGAKQNHLGILNYGLMIIMALVVCKFFDEDLAFVTRGILFVTVGTGFFIANYLMLKKRKSHE